MKTVLLMVVTGDRGLCGGYNAFMLKKSVAREAELRKMGVNVKLICIGNKAITFFKRRPQYDVLANYPIGQSPSTKEAQAIADKIFSNFVAGEVDKVELCFTKFISLVNAQPSIQTLLPMAPSGEMCDVDGNYVDFAEDEIFKLTSKDGEFSVERSKIEADTGSFDASLIFEQDPAQLLDALLPLYMNSTVLRSLQVRRFSHNTTPSWCRRMRWHRTRTRT